MLNIDELIKVGQAPADNKKAWLESAETGVLYVEQNAKSDDIILYACLDQAWICSVLAPEENLQKCDLDNLQRERQDAYSTSGMDYHDGEVFISQPFDYSAIFEGGEQLVFQRRFEYVDDNTYTEISQQLIHSLGVHWQNDHNAYCRLDERGDVEPVLFVLDLSEKTGRKGDILVTIARKELENYMIATGNGMVMQFDFLRFEHGGNFSGWLGPGEMKYRIPDLVYHAQVQGECSFANGSLLYCLQKVRQTCIKSCRGSGPMTTKNTKHLLQRIAKLER